MPKDLPIVSFDYKRNNHQYDDEDIWDIIQEEADRVTIYYEDQYKIIEEAIETNFEYDTYTIEEMVNQNNITKRLAVEAYVIAEQIIINAFKEAGVL